MKKLLLFLIFLALPAYAEIDSSVVGTMWKQEGTVVSPADDVTSVEGVGGVEEGTDVGFGNITATSLNLDAGLGCTPTNPALSFGDGNTGFCESVDNTLSFSASGIKSLDITVAALTGTRSANGANINLSALSAGVVIYGFGADSDTGMARPGINQVALKAGDVEGIRVYKNGVDLKVAVAFSGISSIAADYVMGNFTTDPTFFIECDATLGNISTTLPPIADKKGRLLEIKLMSAANGCYVDGNGAETIDWVAGKAITIRGNAISLIAGSTQWLIY